MTIEVEPKAEECVYQILNKGDLFELEFEVVRGGLLDIEVIVKDPRESVMFRKLSFFNDKSVDEVEEEGYVSIDATRDGVYSICFNNRMSRWTPKTVSFAVPNNSHESGDKEIAKLEHLGPMVDSIIKITDMLDEVEQLQHYMRVREWTHRDTVESTNSRVVWFSAFKSVILIGLSGLQIYYIRGWFADERSRRRV